MSKGSNISPASKQEIKISDFIKKSKKPEESELRSSDFESSPKGSDSDNTDKPNKLS